MGKRVNLQSVKEPVPGQGRPSVWETFCRENIKKGGGDCWFAWAHVFLFLETLVPRVVPGPSSNPAFQVSV